MDSNEIVRQALQLDPAGRLAIAEAILHSLDQPDPKVDAMWIEEAERRLAEYREGKVQTIPAEDFFGRL